MAYGLKRLAVWCLAIAVASCFGGDTDNIGQLYTVEGYGLRIAMSPESCSLVGTADNGSEFSAKLELNPPCYFLTWQNPPPRSKNSPEIGIPIGTLGDPIGWRLPGNNRIVLAIIGDPVSSEICGDNVCRQRNLTHKCGMSIQGVTLGNHRIELTQKRDRVGFLCVELALDAKDFWLLANPH